MELGNDGRPIKVSLVGQWEQGRLLPKSQKGSGCFQLDVAFNILLSVWRCFPSWDCGQFCRIITVNFV